jgi:hypothetical protein
MNLLKVGLSGGVLMSMISICFSIVSTLPLSFFLTEDFVMTSCSSFSFLDYDLVKGLLALVSIVAEGEGKSNFLLLLLVVLAEVTSSNYGFGWGESSFCGE